MTFNPPSGYANTTPLVLTVTVGPGVTDLDQDAGFRRATPTLALTGASSLRLGWYGLAVLAMGAAFSTLPSGVGRRRRS